MTSQESTTQCTDAGQAARPSDGPRLLDERPITGILIHPIVMVTALFGLGILLAGLTWYFSNHEFTRENARNAFNWHATVAGLLIVGLVLSFGVADVFVIPTAAVVFASGFLSILFPLVATVKAIFGEAWKYPFAPELI